MGEFLWMGGMNETGRPFVKIRGKSERWKKNGLYKETVKKMVMEV